MPKPLTAKPSAEGFQTPQFEDFLNPNAMITPGAAGAFTMIITNTLCSQFDNLPPNYTALAVSGLFGAMVFHYGATLGARFLYFIVNSLIIFVVAHGSNTIGSRIEDRYDASAKSAKSDKTAALVMPQTPNKNNFSIASADKPAPGQPESKQGQQKSAKFFRRW
jgi:large-conductance mechanosensitive channel